MGEGEIYLIIPGLKKGTCYGWPTLLWKKNSLETWSKVRGNWGSSEGKEEENMTNALRSERKKKRKVCLGAKRKKMGNSSNTEWGHWR